LELEHANRVATVGQLSASIAREVTQPIAAAITDERNNPPGRCHDPGRGAEERGFGANPTRERLPAIGGDKVQSQQVILNLTINTVQAMTDVGEGSRGLLISTDDAGSEGVLVVVADSGPGLAPAGFERLFEAFYTTKPTGLGMGIPICHAIHTGTIVGDRKCAAGCDFFNSRRLSDPGRIRRLPRRMNWGIAVYWA